VLQGAGLVGAVGTAARSPLQIGTPENLEGFAGLAGVPVWRTQAIGHGPDPPLPGPWSAAAAAHEHSGRKGLRAEAQTKPAAGGHPPMPLINPPALVADHRNAPVHRPSAMRS